MDEIVEVTISVKVTLTREDLVRILAQQLVMSWRYYPRTRRKCLARARHYMEDLIETELRSLEQLHNEFDETRTPPADVRRMMDAYWAQARLTGPKFTRDATEIVKRHFPNLLSEEEFLRRYSE